MDQVVGSYRLIELLGGGGQADVYLGEHQETGDRHASKILYAGLSVDVDAKSAFLQEAIKARSVEHENIVEIIDVGDHEGRPFMVLKYVSKDLASLIAGTPLDEKRAIEIAQQVADALACAHSLGIVHRDIKPQNILVNQAGQVKVADFGISASAFMATIGRTGEVLGTPAYMSPEQWTGEPDHRSDICSLGVVIYEMLTGTLHLSQTPRWAGWRLIEPARSRFPRRWLMSCQISSLRSLKNVWRRIQNDDFSRRKSFQRR